MAITAEHTPYGKPAAERLAGLVGRLKGGDPLAPVTVVVPANTAGLATRRALAGAARGIAAVDFLRLYDLAERLAGSHMALRHGRKPLSDRVLSAAVRNALTAEGIVDADFLVSYQHIEEKGSDVNVASHLLLVAQMRRWRGGPPWRTRESRAAEVARPGCASDQSVNCCRIGPVNSVELVQLGPSKW